MRHFNISVPPVIFPIKDFSRKTLNDVGFDLRRKGITTSKSEIPNSCHAVWNVDTSEGFTIAKGAIPNICHRIWNVDTSEGITTRKSVIPNTCHTIWNIDAFKGFAIRVFTTDYYSIFYR